MIVAIAAAGAALRAALIRFPTAPDPRFPTHYAVGATMPFPVIMNHESGWVFLTMFFALMVVLATASLWAARSLAGAGSRAPTLLIAGLAVLVSVFSFFPVTFSLDAYAYAAFGRLLGVDHFNPYLEHVFPALTFSDPLLAKLTTFLGRPLPDENYGPLWTLFAGAAALVAQAGGVALNVWMHRAAGAVMLVVAALGTLRLLARVEPGERARRAALFALHPAALCESAAAGHNDILMIAPAIWAFALVDDAPLIAGVLAGLAVAVKYAALIVLPFLAVRAYRAKGPLTAAASVAIAAAVPALCFLPVSIWPGWQTARTFVRLEETLVMSPHWLASMWLPASIDGVVITVILGLTAVVVVGYSVVRYVKKPCGEDIFRSIAVVLWASPLLNPWYVQWLLPAAAAGGRWARYAWWFGLFALLRYVEDALRFPDSSGALAQRIVLLEAIAVAILVVPLALCRLPALPFQRVTRDDG